MWTPSIKAKTCVVFFLTVSFLITNLLNGDIYFYSKKRVFREHNDGYWFPDFLIQLLYFRTFTGFVWFNNSRPWKYFCYCRCKPIYLLCFSSIICFHSNIGIYTVLKSLIVPSALYSLSNISWKTEPTQILIRWIWENMSHHTLHSHTKEI